LAGADDADCFFAIEFPQRVDHQYNAAH
jgi:hypothetical protein